MTVPRRRTRPDPPADHPAGPAPLPLARVRALLSDLRAGSSPDARRLLVEHHLAVAWEAAQLRASAAAAVDDLYQEGAVAVVTSVDGYAAGAGPASGLRAHVEKEVGLRVGEEADRLEGLRRHDERLALDAEQLERSRFELRHRLGRPATDAEVAAALEWTAERVATVSEMVSDAHSRYDQEISLYLDDEES